MLRHSRWTPFSQVPATVGHVRAQLSAVDDPNDNPDIRAAFVHIDLLEQDGGMLVVGELDAQPTADYLRHDFDPEADVAANPLSVTSIEDQP